MKKLEVKSMKNETKILMTKNGLEVINGVLIVKTR